MDGAAARLIVEENYGNMVALRREEIVPVPLGGVAGKLKTVPPDSSVVGAARQISVCMGDE